MANPHPGRRRSTLALRGADGSPRLVAAAAVRVSVDVALAIIAEAYGIEDGDAPVVPSSTMRDGLGAADVTTGKVLDAGGGLCVGSVVNVQVVRLAAMHATGVGAASARTCEVTTRWHLRWSHRGEVHDARGGRGGGGATGGGRRWRRRAVAGGVPVAAMPAAGVVATNLTTNGVLDAVAPASRPAPSSFTSWASGR